MNLCREVPDTLDSEAGNQTFAKGLEVQPLELRPPVLQGTVVQVEPVNVEIGGGHKQVRSSTENAKAASRRLRALPPKQSEGVPSPYTAQRFTSTLMILDDHFPTALHIVFTRLPRCARDDRMRAFAMTERET